MKAEFALQKDVLNGFTQQMSAMVQETCSLWCSTFPPLIGSSKSSQEIRTPQPLLQVFFL